MSVELSELIERGSVTDDGRSLRFGGGSVHYINESGEPDAAVLDALKSNQDIANAIEQWSQSLSQTGNDRTLDVFNRNRWQGAQHTLAVMSQCSWAVDNDDILSTTCDVVEGLMWQKCHFEVFDDDQQDIWNQWAGTINLDSLLRKMGRELFKVSQVYVGMWWANKKYRVKDAQIPDKIDEFREQAEYEAYERAVRERQAMIERHQGAEGFIEPPEIPEPKKKSRRGNRTRRREFNLKVPTAVTIFDPTKIVPVGSSMFGQERFAYVADLHENESFTKAHRLEVADPMAMQLLEEKYTPSQSERATLGDLGVNPDHLWLMRTDAVFRHTLTKSDYERFAPVRLKSALPLLEMKQHVRASDRASLIGNTNFIVVITKGSDKYPAKAAEIENLREQARIIARLPVLVGDHRLNVDIVAPPLDNTLIESRWQVLDSRLVFKALQSYSPVVQGGNSSGTGVSEMSRVIARGMESRRHMVLRTLEAKMFDLIVEANEDLDETPSLEFTPRRISLDFNADIIGQILKLRDRGDISRETTLEEIDFDQDVEVLRRSQEKIRYDEVFSSATPHSSPQNNPYSAGQTPPPPTPPPGTPGSNLGPDGQPRTEGGRPRGVPEDEPRARKGADA